MFQENQRTKNRSLIHFTSLSLTFTTCKTRRRTCKTSVRSAKKKLKNLLQGSDTFGMILKISWLNCDFYFYLSSPNFFTILNPYENCCAHYPSNSVIGIYYI